MASWRMQLHPNDATYAVKHSITALGRGYIGLDFKEPPGDLMTVGRESLGEQKKYWPFAHGMRVGDFVLIIAHNYPFALAEVVGEYNYCREPRVEMGFWFRHFRRVRVLGYYADYASSPAAWEQLAMVDAFSPLKDASSRSWVLIQEWVEYLPGEVKQLIGQPVEGI